MPDVIAAATDAQRARAAVRARAVAAALDLIAAGHSPLQADTMAAEVAGVRRATVMRWRQRAESGDAGALVAGTSRGRPPGAWTAPGAEDAWTVWCRDYLRRSKPGSAACWRRVRDLARIRGWSIPSEATFRARLRRDVPPEEIVRCREGALAALALYPAQVRTTEGMAPLDCVSGDGKRHDVFVEMSDGRIVRLVVWYWQDVRTRRIVAWHWGETESWDLVRLAFARMCDGAGVPRMVVIDNTFAASARAIAGSSSRRWKSDDEDVPGIFESLGIRVVHTHVEREDSGKGIGWGQAKPVERAFGVGGLQESIDKHPLCEGAYTGSHPAAKPANYGAAAVPLDTFLGVVEEGVAEWNRRDGRRIEGSAGRSPDAMWAEEIVSTPIRRLSAEQRAIVLLAVESTAVQRDGTFTLAAGKGVGLPRNRYQHDALRRLMHRRAENRRVIARFDPRDLHAGVHVFDVDGRHICFAECLHPVGFGDTEAAREHGRARGRYRRHLDAAARERDAIEALQQTYGVSPVAAGPGAEPKVVELVRTERRAEAEQVAAERDERDERFARAVLSQLRR